MPLRPARLERANTGRRRDCYNNRRLPRRQQSSHWLAGPARCERSTATRKPPPNRPTCMAKKRVSERLPSAGPGPPMAIFSRLSPTQRQKGEEAGSRLGRGVAVLVPGEQVAGQDGRQGEQPEPHGGPKHQFPRRSIRAGQNALHDGDDQHGQEHVGRVVMDRPKQPAAGDLVLDEVDAFPRGLGAGAIVGPEEEAGDRLDAEEERDDARPDPATARPARNRRVGQAAAASRRIRCDR